METVKNKTKNDIYKYHWHFNINTYFKKVILNKYLLPFSQSDFRHVAHIVVLLLMFLVRRQKNKFHVVSEFRKRNVRCFH